MEVFLLFYLLPFQLLFESHFQLFHHEWVLLGLFGKDLIGNFKNAGLVATFDASDSGQFGTAIFIEILGFQFSIVPDLL